MNRKDFLTLFLFVTVVSLTSLSCHNKDAIPKVDFTIDFNDANHPEYQSLNAIGGTVVIAQYQILVGKGVNGYFAVSSFCTYHNCTLGYQASYDVLQCPCATCQFNTSGGVIMGPATNPLIVYATQLSGQYLRVYSP